MHPPSEQFCQRFLEVVEKLALCAFHFLFPLLAAVNAPEGPGVRTEG
jgi:hypothetical protein